MGSELKPVAFMCPAGCGCLWRDNNDGTMSLFGKRSVSCEVCETMPLFRLTPLCGYAEVEPLYSRPKQAGVTEAMDRWHDLLGRMKGQLTSSNAAFDWKIVRDYHAELCSIKAALQAAIDAEGDGNG